MSKTLPCENWRDRTKKLSVAGGTCWTVVDNQYNFYGTVLKYNYCVAPEISNYLKVNSQTYWMP